MTLATSPLSDALAGRERASRVFAVAGILYSLIALMSAGVAALGLFGIAGPVDPVAVESAQLLGLPWSLAITPALATTPVMTLSMSCGAMALNAMLILLAGRVMRGGGR